MDRRTFIKSTISASVLAASSAAAGRISPLFAGSDESPVDLVAVRGGEPDVMFDRGIAALGGMRAFVSRGDRVVVKPNIGWDVAPERGGNTHPALVSRIIRQCFDAGAGEVYVFDHTCDSWKNCYRTSGIEKAAKDAGAKVVPGNSESYYHPVVVQAGRTLTRAKEHELLLESDIFINVPVLKSHSSARVTIGMKNLMGVVWDRGFWHSNDLHQCIADFATYRKPTLNVVDAYYVMKRNGPRGVSVEDVTTMKAQLLSTDIVAIDSAAAKLFGIEPRAVRHIQLAADRKVGRMDLDRLNIKRITV